MLASGATARTDSMILRETIAESKQRKKKKCC